MTFLEAKVGKWRATACTIWRVERPKVASATAAFAEAMRLNHQLSSKVGSALAKLLCTKLDSDELSNCYKDLQEEKKNLAKKVDSMAIKKDELAKVVADFEARLKESESRLLEKGKPTKSLRRSCLFTRRRSWNNMKRALTKPSGRPGSLPRNLTWVFLTHSRM